MGTADVLMSIPAVQTFQTSVEEAGGTVVLDTEAGWSHQNTCEQSYTDERLDWLFAHVRGASTGIDHPCVDAASSAAIYDLSGRRTDLPSRGIYIQNGRKYVR